MSCRVLFILKRKEDFNPVKDSKIGLTTGLYNSASFMYQMLLDCGVETKIVVVIDNNGIDKEVTEFKPTHVIIEALWVVPTKFSVLCNLHPSVKWIIRLHSEIPFLANEGMAMDWLGDYISYPNVLIAVNSPRTLNEIKFYLGYKMNWDDFEKDNRIIYLPNFYPQDYKTKTYTANDKDIIDIGCFGAVRPLKNHIMQAIAAVKFADSINKKLRFHVNGGRVEQKGEPVMRNLIGFFSQLSDKGHQLINHGWQDREDFSNICAQMDIGMQVSITETFNIVGADIISQGVPLVGSKEIPWIDSWFVAKATQTEEIYAALLLTHQSPNLNVTKNQKELTIYANKTKDIWLEYFK